MSNVVTATVGGAAHVPARERNLPEDPRSRLAQTP